MVIASVAAASLLVLWPASAAPAVPHAGACEREIERASGTGVPRLAIVGASFTAGVGSGPGRSWAVVLARHLRWDAVVDGVPGAGYVRAGAGRAGSPGVARRRLQEPAATRVTPSAA